MKYINVILLQWFFIRLTKCQERIIDEFDLFEVSLMPDNTYASGGRIKSMSIYGWYSIQYWVIPLTGWWNNFKYIRQPKFLRLTKKYKL